MAVGDVHEHAAQGGMTVRNTPVTAEAMAYRIVEAALTGMVVGAILPR